MWRRVIVVLALVLPLSLSGMLAHQPVMALDEVWEYGDDAVVFFSTAGCARCKQLAPEIAESCEMNNLELIEYDLNTHEGLIRMYTLLYSRDLPVEWAGKAPSLFTETAQVIAASTPADLVPLFTSEVSVIPDQPHTVGVFLAGLADGVNPCTLNVLLILLSICLLTDRRRVASTGFLFIAGVVGTYLLVGLGLGKILAPLQRGTILMSFLYIVFGIGLMYLVLRPPTNALNGIKTALGKRIRSIRRPGMGYLAIFAIGVLSSAFEFVCTGQIYVPYVLYLSSNAPAVLVGNLVLYNIAFALPMIALVMGFSCGLSSEAIQRLLKTPIIQQVGLVATAFLGVYFLATGVIGVIS